MLCLLRSSLVVVVLISKYSYRSPYCTYIHLSLSFPQVSYYIEATGADNHAVREAACACIAELALKLTTDAVRQHVPRLLHALTVCFTDDSWPVRDGEKLIITCHI